MGSSSDFVREILKHKVDPTSRDATGNTPLHYASFPSRIGNYGEADTLDVLLSHQNVDPDLPNREGNSPLHLSSNYEIVRTLLSHGAQPSKKNTEGNTLLHLLFRNPKWPIHMLERIVFLLLDHHADANVVNEKGETPLHVLLQRGPQFVDSCAGIVHKMMERGALDLSIRDEKGRSYYDIALHRFRTGFETYRMLMVFRGALEKERKKTGGEQQSLDWLGLANKGGATPFHFLASSLHAPTIEGHLEEMRKVLREGLTGDEMDKDGVTPLHVVLQLQDPESILGVIPYFPDLPLYVVWEEEVDGVAVIKRKLEFSRNFVAEVVRFLICEAKVDPNQTTMNALSPLHLAPVSPLYTPPLIHYLIEGGGDSSFPNLEGEDPLIVLLRRQQPSLEIVKEMLKRGVNSKSSLGEEGGALVVLAENFQRSKWTGDESEGGVGGVGGVDWVGYFRLVLEAGGSANSVRGDGVTVLQLLLESVSTMVKWRVVSELLELLREWGIDFVLPGGKGTLSKTSPLYTSVYSSFSFTSYPELACRSFHKYKPSYRIQPDGLECNQSSGEEFHKIMEILLQGAGISGEDVKRCEEALNLPYRSFSDEDREDMKEWGKQVDIMLKGFVFRSVSIKGARRR